ncbi:hypothetical protein BDV09DRAFT_201108 [Aspergillus tetrazonus]
MDSFRVIHADANPGPRHFEVWTVHFPATLSQEDKSCLERIEGPLFCIPESGGPDDRLEALRGFLHRSHGWMEGEVEYQGQIARRMNYIFTWECEAAEERYKPEMRSYGSEILLQGLDPDRFRKHGPRHERTTMEVLLDCLEECGMFGAVSLDSDGTATNGLTGAANLFPGDDGSQGGENDIYIGPDMWTNDTAEVACRPPCTLILPPFPLSTPVTISWPEYVTSIASSSAGTIYTKTTTISIKPFEVTEIPFWPTTVAESSQFQALFSPTQSIAPPTTNIIVEEMKQWKCLQVGGGGGAGSEDTNPNESSTSCTSTASPTVTTICDYACKDASDTACATLCTSLTVTEGCEPTTGFGSLQIGDVSMEDWDLDDVMPSDKEMEAHSSSIASWLNPFYTDWDPVLISGTTLTISATPPDVTTKTASKTTQTAVSVTSCDLRTTSTSSSSQKSTYCACDGGYGLSLSTETNARKSTYLICDAYPPTHHHKH